jgi:hypothetical protein
MATYDEVLQLARQLPPEARGRLARTLEAPAASGSGAMNVGFGPRPPAPQSVGWLKAERGHAVLATDVEPDEAALPQGAAALAGIWSDRREGGRREGGQHEGGQHEGGQ